MTDGQKLNMIIKAAKDVREKQKAYFKARKANLPIITSKLLEDSKASERLLDELISNFETPENTQKSLF